MVDVISKIIKIEDITPEFVAKLKQTFPVQDENPDWDEEKTRTLVSNPKNLFIIGYQDEEPAAFVYGHDLDRFDNKREFFIYEVSTAPGFRRRGIMTKVFGFMLEHLKQEGFEAAWVLTNKSNEAGMGFYQATGATIPNGDDLMFEYKL